MAITTETISMDSTTAWQSHPLDALIAINQQITDQDISSSCARSVNFMAYELVSLCQNKTEAEAFAELNSFFFLTKKFRFAGSPVLLQNILATKSGCGIALALLYMHLGRQLGLNLHLIHWPLHTILQWECEGRSQYVDLEQQGKVLSEDELLSMINKHKDQVRTLALHQALVQYLAYMSTNYRQHEEYEPLHKTLSLILRLEPENTRVLAERAILRRNLGLIKESMADFKRYFAFTDRATASPEVVAVYETVRVLHSP